ncbi:MAG: DUF342 domain-containing protein [Desulfobacter sp.]|nr:MAG: DUF342 domain-containing protein [Desulfobacter sp.]
MTDSDRPKILILEDNAATSDRVMQILEERGWEAVCEHVSKSALERLEQAMPDSPFHLLISNFRLPKMEGDDILKQAKAISPMTRRVLTVPSDQPDMVIRAINKAEIHACIVTPATDQELVDRVKCCIEAFDKEMKQEKLRRVVTHQNKQLFVIAQRLKKKAKICKERISSRKKEKLRLTTVLAEANRQEKDPVTLDQRIKARNIEIAPGPLNRDFQILFEFIRVLFDRIARQAGIAFSLEDLPAILTENETATTPENENEAGQQEADPTREEFVRQVLRTTFSSPLTPAIDTSDTEEAPPEQQTLGDLVSTRISEDRVRAFIRLKAEPVHRELLDLADLLNLLRQRQISFGIIEDRAIESWMADALPGQDEFMIAEGAAPVLPVDGTLTYEFHTDYTNPGKIMEDGRMDFRDRGEIPFVAKGDILAVKTPAQEGEEGMTVTGEPITVDEPEDPVMIAGSGTKLSEDGLTVHADLDGQPHLDPMGEISINPELPVKGDVDYKTGNIEFNGNIVVAGTVKDGFTVKGVSLTAKEIQGGIIDLSGDLCVTDGITDADIVSVGNVYAKFINNSKVNAFGNVVVQKEIIDSGILLSGGVENPTGVIMSSQITAKAGVDGGRIGTDTSKPSRLKVGVDDHLETRIKAIDDQLDALRKRQGDIRGEMKRIEEDDRELYSKIMEKAQEQEQLQGRINTLKASLADLKQQQDRMGLDRALKDVKKLSASLKRTDEELTAIFNIQDSHARQIEKYKATMDEIETDNKTLVLKKKGLRDYSKKMESHPAVTVNKSITQETVIMGPNITLTLTEDRKRCRIQEQQIEEDGLHHYRMEISEL